MRFMNLSGWRFVAVLCVLTPIISSRSPALAADTTANAPWLAPGNEEKYVFVGKQVWEVDSGQNVAPTGAPKVWLGPEVRRIVGADDRVYAANPGNGRMLPGMTTRGVIQPLDFSQLEPVTLDKKPYTDSFNNPSFWIASDRRRVVFIQNGDFWRGEIDWPHAQIVNRKQVTQVGQFSPANPPILWWGNVLLVWGDFDKNKPIVRIDLISGATEEIATYNGTLGRALNERSAGEITSSGNCRVAKWTPSVFYSYDVRTGKTTSFQNKYESIPGPKDANVLSEFDAYWTDDETAYIPMTIGYLTKLDFRNSKMEILAKPEQLSGAGSVNHQVRSILPGKRYADIIFFHGTEQGGPVPFKERYLLDFTTGKHIPLPFDDQNYGVWLDDDKFFYVREKGGLGQAGVWLYNRADNSNKRLGGGTIDTARMVHLPKKNIVMGVSQQNGWALRKVNLDGSGIQDLGACEAAIPTRMPEESVDLGFTDTKVDLWKPPTVDEKALAATEAPEAATGKVKLDQLTKDLPQDQRDFAINAYDYAATNSMLSSYYDPLKFAMILLDAHKAKPDVGFNQLLMGVDYSAAIDPEHIRRWGIQQATAWLQSDWKSKPEQKAAIAEKTGQSLFDAYSAKPQPDIKDVNALCRKFWDEAKAAVAGGQTAQNQQQASSQPPPATQPTTTPQQQTDASKSPHQSDVDKNIDKAKKAKDTADKIKGIFGR